MIRKLYTLIEEMPGDKEERPLHFVEMPEGIYFSSLAEPLLAIRTKDTQKVLIASPNVLYTFTQKDGIVNKVLIDREKEWTKTKLNLIMLTKRTDLKLTSLEKQQSWEKRLSSA
jgi:hypothetical protein